MKYLFVFVVIAFTVEVNAQTSKGSFMIGGSLRLQRAQTHYNPVVQALSSSILGSFGVSPTVGYFFVKNLMTGIETNYTYHWALNTDNSDGYSVAVGPIVRYYIPVGKFAVFPELAGSYKHESYNSFVVGTGLRRIEQNYKVYRAGAGVTWFASPNIGIEGILAYQNSIVDNSVVTNQTNLYFNIGLQFYLPKKD